MIFNATVSVLDISVVQTDDHVQLALALATYLPTPQGDIPIPIGIVNVPMSKEVARTKGQELLDAGQVEEGEEPAPQHKSDLIVAKSLQGVEQAAEMDRKIKGK